ncbi:hypothetical protein, partial [Cupriavidus taiwanensis]|uniref:hypothetical protein n=1 Tax=Cupriavidus taiwanensis TaxID=164546 RepID=UPI0039EA04D6
QRAALSAAEKRDYAELSSFRQPFAAIFFTAAGAANCAAPTFPVDPATLAAPALQGPRCVARGRIVGRFRRPCNTFVTTLR